MFSVITNGYEQRNGMNKMRVACCKARGRNELHTSTRAVDDTVRYMYRFEASTEFNESWVKRVGRLKKGSVGALLLLG